MQNTGKPLSRSTAEVVLWAKLAYNGVEYVRKYKEDPP